MKFLLPFAMRALGLGKALDAVNGQTSKAYIGGVGQILSGIAAIVGGSANLVMSLLPLHGAAEYLAFAKGLSQDTNAAVILGGVALLSKGIADIGQRHALAKAVNADAAPSALP